MATEIFAPNTQQRKIEVQHIFPELKRKKTSISYTLSIYGEGRLRKDSSHLINVQIQRLFNDLITHTKMAYEYLSSLSLKMDVSDSKLTIQIFVKEKHMRNFISFKVPGAVLQIRSRMISRCVSLEEGLESNHCSQTSNSSYEAGFDRRAGGRVFGCYYG